MTENGCPTFPSPPVVILRTPDLTSEGVDKVAGMEAAHTIKSTMIAYLSIPIQFDA